VEVPVTTASTQANADNNFTFRALVYESNGTVVSANTTQWRILLDYDNNKSAVASLSTDNGESTQLSLSSTLRRGRVDDVKVLSRGANYSNNSVVKLIGDGIDFNGSLIVGGNGEIIDVNISNSGAGYTEESQFIIEDANGSGGILKAVLGGGNLILQANMTRDGGQHLSAEVAVMASLRSRLSEREQWLDLFLDSIVEPAPAWWNDDNESDGLSNLEEFSLGTNPFASDTDGDGLTDGNETNGTAYNGMLVKTNPLLVDTDGDGRTDYAEFYEGNQTHALLADTDGDGLSDGEEIDLGLNPLSVDQTASIGGIIFVPQEVNGSLYLVVEANPDSLADPDFSSVTPLSGVSYPYVYRFRNKAMNVPYRVSAFIDVVNDGSHENGEPIASWSGTLSKNVFNANLVLLDAEPTLVLEGTTSVVAERGETFRIGCQSQ
jgi:hypothetical protein